MIFLDANVILRFILDDNPKLSPKAKSIFQTINQGKTRVFISQMAVHEVVFTLQRTYKLPKSNIRQKFSELIKSENILVDKREILEKALFFYEDKNISFADAYQAALMLKKKVKKIYSFDKHFDRFPQIKRLVD
ncbi:MAG: PIN domain-containing protein [Candidatus Blackburnbacteria bacterium]|nr:PIN domain-containing protein [Candidatus Blackburnbacteria bacterium]